MPTLFPQAKKTDVGTVIPTRCLPHLLLKAQSTLHSQSKGMEENGSNYYGYYFKEFVALKSADCFEILGTRFLPPLIAKWNRYVKLLG